MMPSVDLAALAKYGPPVRYTKGVAASWCNRGTPNGPNEYLCAPDAPDLLFSDTVIIATNKAERDEFTQLPRADLYAQGKLGREAVAVPVLVEQRGENLYRVEAYEPGDKIQFKTGSPSIEYIPHDSEATVLATRPKGNLLTVHIDATKNEVTYSPSQLRQQTRESRIFREEVREIAEGERIRFTASDRETVVRPGDLETVTRIGQDRSMRVQLDSDNDGRAYAREDAPHRLCVCRKCCSKRSRRSHPRDRRPALAEGVPDKLSESGRCLVPGQCRPRD